MREDYNQKLKCKSSTVASFSFMMLISSSFSSRRKNKSVKREAGRRKRSNLPSKSTRRKRRNNFHKRTGRKRRNNLHYGFSILLSPKELCR
jgi:hypothetical protein